MASTALQPGDKFTLSEGPAYSYNGNNTATALPNDPGRELTPATALTPVPQKYMPNVTPEQPVSTSTLSASALTYPDGTPTKDPNAVVSAIQANIDPAFKSALEQATALRDATATSGMSDLEKQQNDLYDQFQADSKLLEGKAAAYKAKESELGVDQTLKQLQDENLKLTELSNQFDTAYNNENSRLTTMGDILGSQSEIRRQQAVEVGAQAAKVAALQGNYELASSRAKEAVDLQFAPIEQRIQNTQAFLQLNEARLTREEKKQADKLTLALDLQQKALDKQKEARQFALENGINSSYYEMGGVVYRTSDGKAYSTPEEFFKDSGQKNFAAVQHVDQTLKQQRDLVVSLAANYPDAGILPTDSLPTATAKLKRSAKYQSEITPKYITVKAADGSDMLFNPSTGTYQPGYKPPVSAGAESVANVAAAIGQYESGGNYSAIGKTTASGDRAYGKYQIMGNNVRAWTKQILGREMSPEEFLGDHAAQDAVAQAKLGDYLTKYGTVEDAASMWFSGRPVSKAGQATDVNGTSVPQYVKAVRSIYDKQSGGKSQLLSKDQLSLVNQLTDNIRQDNDIKYFQDVRNAYQRIQTTDKSGVGDLTLLRLYAKITDPTTGVREEEFKSMESAQGALARLGINLTKGQLNGERLTDSARQQFMDAAQKLYQKALGNYEQKYQLYTNQAIAANIDPSLVLTNITAGDASYSIQAPDGNTYTFDSQEALNQFKQAAGIK